MKRKIQLSNLPDIVAVDKARIDSALAAFYDKLKRIVNNEVLLHVHFKEFELQGKRKRRKHSVQLHLSVPGLEITASALDWNLLTAVQKGISRLEREAIRRMKNSPAK